MVQSAAAFALEGGLDLVTAAVKMPPGRVIAALNYEPNASGYRRLIGYERFDGRTAPSSSTDPATIATLRSAIGAVPGSGPVRAIIPNTLGPAFPGPVLAIRDNGPATAAEIYAATPGGWGLVALTNQFSFDQGGIDGEALTEGTAYDTTSGAGGSSYSVVRFVVTSGSWAGGDAAGYGYGGSGWAVGSYLYRTTGNSTVRVCRIAAAPSAVTIPPGGAYKWTRHNFFGAANRTRTYIANGVGKAFELGSTGAPFVVQINSGMTTDTPTHIAEHRNSLFLAFRGGSIQFSTVGEPLDFDPVTGAGELSVGSDVTDFATPPNSLGILSEQGIHILYGNDASDYVLEELSDASGALPHTAQEIGGVVYMDNRGLRKLSAAQGFGNFRMGTLSALIAPLLEDKRRDSIEPSASLVCRSADQYWLFFEDGTGFVAYLGGKQPSILPFNLEITVTCATSVEDDGVERLFVGASNGFVYELNKGTSFDGEVIEHYIRLPFNNFGSPGQNKQFHRFTVDIEASGSTSLSASFDLDYGSVQGLVEQSFTVTTGGGAIDDLGTNELYYTSQIEAVAELYIDGVAKNISAKIGGETSHEQPHTLTAATYYVTPLAMDE